MSKIWFTSDLHFNHDQPFIWKDRGYSSVQEINEEQVARFYSFVTHEDTVYILGDCMMGMDISSGLAYLRRLNGTKYLVIGNHATAARIEEYKKSGIFADIQFAYRLRHKGHSYFLSHYPTITANGEDLRTVNLFGHTHQTTTHFEDRKYMYHVGVDSNYGFPISLDEIHEYYKGGK